MGQAARVSGAAARPASRTAWFTPMFQPPAGFAPIDSGTGRI
jgi:hypothetical protein